jgi:hypothetical protein
MQADSEPWVLAGVLRCLDRRSPVDHQARARDDAAFMRLDHAAVDAAAVAEVVGIHYEIALASHNCPPSLVSHYERCPAE